MFWKSGYAFPEVEMTLTVFIPLCASECEDGHW